MQRIPSNGYTFMICTWYFTGTIYRFASSDSKFAFKWIDAQRSRDSVTATKLPPRQRWSIDWQLSIYFSLFFYADPLDLTCISEALLEIRSDSRCCGVWASPWPFTMPFGPLGPGPQRGCQMAAPCKYISSPSPKGSPHLVHRAQVGWKWWLSPACSTFPLM